MEVSLVEHSVAPGPIRIVDAAVCADCHRRTLPTLIARARILAHQGDPERLVKARAVEVLEQMVPNPRTDLLTAIVLGEVGLERQDPAMAERWSRRTQEDLRRYPDAGALRGRAEGLRNAVEEAQSREPLTPSEQKVLVLLSTHLTEGQIAGRLFASKNTVKTHLRGLYRKLQVSTRSQAVDGARQLGLLKVE